jgi:ABC-type branched-subunit amino acid transport system ATPase component
MEKSTNKKNCSFFYTNKITVAFGGLAALTNVNIEIEKNEIRGLIGPNGAGKTTFFNVVSGYVQAKRGEIFFQGEEISALKPHEIAKKGIIRTFQKRGILPSLTALENVLLGYHRSMEAVKLWDIGFRLKKFGRLEMEAIQQAREALNYVGIGAVSDQVAKELSFGQQTLVEIARTLISKPRLLLLDEPAAGLSSVERDHVRSVLRTLVDEQGVSLIIADHVMDFVMEICEHLTVLNFGEILAEGDADYVRQHKGVLEAYLGG